jgi:hypothetical protein
MLGNLRGIASKSLGDVLGIDELFRMLANLEKIGRILLCIVLGIDGLVV